MSFFTAMSISGSGLTAEQTRMDTISDNIANVNTTQTVEGGPYQREETVFTDSHHDLVLCAASTTDSAGDRRGEPAAVHWRAGL